MVRDGPRLLHRLFLRCGRHEDAGRSAVVSPSVIWANDRVVLNKTLGKPRTAVDAKIFPHMRDTILVAPRDQITLQQRDRKQLSGDKLCGIRHDVPLIEQDLVLARLRQQ